MFLRGSCKEVQRWILATAATTCPIIFYHFPQTLMLWSYAVCALVLFTICVLPGGGSWVGQGHHPGGVPPQQVDGVCQGVDG